MSEKLELNAAQEKFDIYYNEKILPVLQNIEQKRKKMLRIFCLMLPLVSLWMLYALMQLFQTQVTENPTMRSIYGLTLCLAILAACWPMFSYYRNSKESLLPLLAGFWGNFSYDMHQKISEQTIQYSKIINSFDEFQTDDCFNGTYEGMAINIAEYLLYQKKHIHEKGKTYTTKMKIGQGILFSAEMSKRFSGQTIVVKDKGVLNYFARYKNLSKVGLESPEFEKAYEVYSDNQIEARYLLTAVMLEYMLELKKIFPKTSFSFFDQKVFINIETDKNLFECSSFFRSVLNKKRINKIFEEFYYLFAIIRILHLNQKQIL